ncbi:hypothetical protein D3C80_1738250 [compost metagenome]
MDRIARLREFLAQSPQDPFLVHALALEYVKNNALEEAEKYFSDNLKERPEYVATYYHLGKLLERTGKESAAAEIYEAGIERARAAGDMHAMGELRSALDNLI